MADVFVSYHKSDRARAEEAVASLTEHGYSVWWDDRVTPMESWDKIVEREIKQAKCVLVLWTGRSVESEWVRIEANFAKVAKPAKLVQVRLEECDVPMNFSLIQHANAFGPLDPEINPGWARALEWVGLFVGVRPDAAPKPAVEPAPAPKPRKSRAKQAEAPTSPPPAPPPPKRAASLTGPSIAARIAAAFKFDADASYYRTGLIALAGAALGGALLYALLRDTALNNEWAILFSLAPLSLRLLLGAALAFVLVRTGRLDQRRALLFLGALLALHIGLRIIDAILTPTPVSWSSQSLIVDLASVAGLWAIARFFGALQPQRSYRAPIWATVAVLVHAVWFAIAVENTGGPEIYDTGIWTFVLTTWFFLETLLLLALFEPLRAKAPAVQT